MRSRLRVPPATAVGRADRGSVTAETVVVLPLLAALTVALVWVVSLAATQVRVVDAARETARAAARDESAVRAIELGRRVAPPASRIAVHDAGDSVVVDVVASVRGPGGVLRFLPAVHLSSHAVAAKELP